jgi:hypothetical protein
MRLKIDLYPKTVLGDLGHTSMVKFRNVLGSKKLLFAYCNYMKSFIFLFGHINNNSHVCNDSISMAIKTERFPLLCLVPFIGCPLCAL